MKWMRRKTPWLMFLCTVMIFGSVMTANAAAGRLRIRLEHGNKSSWTEGIQIPVVTVNFSEETPEWSKDPEHWIPGKKVTAVIKVPDVYTSSECTVYGGKLLSVKAGDEESEIRVTYVPAAKLEATEKAGWSDTTKTKASWKKVPFASKYQVVLYKEGGIWVKSLTTSSTSVDLLKYMENGTKYYYTVKAVLKDSSEEEYLKEGEPVVSDDSVVQELGETNGTWAEYKDGKKYRCEDGTYAVDSWKMIGGKWYYFNKDGFAMTGWQHISDHWYYLGADHVMLTGWQQINGKWYYLNPAGDMATGWIQPQPDKWYYLYSDGSMAVNTIINDLYSVDSSGLWVQSN